MKRNYAIDFFRIFFTCLICMHHFQDVFNVSIIKSGYVAVEFFFILSGFLLYKSFQRNPEESAVKYTIKKLRRLYPEYLLAFSICFILNLLQKNEGWVDYIFKAVQEITLTQNIGIFKGSFNYPLWYLSVLIFGGYLLYALLKKNKKDTIHILLPAIIIFTYSILLKEGKGLENWNTINGLYIPLLRGIADMSIGILVANAVNSEYWKKLELHIKGLYVIEIISYILLGILIMLETKYEMTCIIFISILIGATQIDNSLTNRLFNRRIIGNIALLTYPMYLNHASILILVSWLYRRGLTDKKIIIIIYFIALIVLSGVSKEIIKIIYKLKDNKKNLKYGG